jgi:hypothetical protein
MSIYADHIGMTKFSTKDDAGYKAITYAIDELLEDLTQGYTKQPRYVLTF